MALCLTFCLFSLTFSTFLINLTIFLGVTPVINYNERHALLPWLHLLNVNFSNGNRLKTNSMVTLLPLRLHCAFGNQITNFENPLSYIWWSTLDSKLTLLDLWIIGSSLFNVEANSSIIIIIDHFTNELQLSNL